MIITTGSEIYSRVITAASEHPSGEVVREVLTQEINCYICWLQGYAYARHVLDVETHRNFAIEHAVELGKLKEHELAAIQFPMTASKRAGTKGGAA